MFPEFAFFCSERITALFVVLLTEEAYIKTESLPEWYLWQQAKDLLYITFPL